MKPVDYPNNGRGMMVQYHRMREGPSYFTVHYKNSSVLRQDPKDAWRVLGPAKFTPGAQELKQWCIDIDEQYSKDKKEGRKDTSFSTDIQQELNDNTKMIT
tara:strand:+ start:7544 stop:7846 length:303 start_codon:yes stop_codon:yes gene_type:complete